VFGVNTLIGGYDAWVTTILGSVLAFAIRGIASPGLPKRRVRLLRDLEGRSAAIAGEAAVETAGYGSLRTPHIICKGATGVKVPPARQPRFPSLPSATRVRGVRVLAGAHGSSWTVPCSREPVVASISAAGEERRRGAGRR
jgi:hypothetical protein